MPVYYLIGINGVISKYDNITPIFVEKPISGIGSDQPIMIDWRPANNTFYIIAQNGVNATVYEIDAETMPNATASNPVPLTMSSNPFVFPSSFVFGDFDPINVNILTVVENLTTYSVNIITGDVTIASTISGGTPYGPWRCGQAAALALADRIGRHTVHCEGRDVDRWKRLIAICRRAGEDLSAWMVRNGLALAFRRYAKDYVQAENDARLARRGLWSGAFAPPWAWRRDKAAALVTAAAQP